MFKRRHLWWQIGISIACLAWLAMQVNLGQIWETVQLADWRAWPWVLVTYMAFMFLRAWRWQMMLGRHAKYWPVFHAQSIGYLLTNVLPFRLGDLGRAYVIGQQPQLSSSHVLSTIVVERILDMVVIVLLFTCTLPSAPVVDPLVRQAGIGFGVLTGLGIGLLGLAVWQESRALTICRWLLVRQRWLDRQAWLNRIASFISGFQVLRDWRVLLRVLSASLTIWLAIAVTYYIGIRAFWPTIPWQAAVFALCVSTFGVSVPSSPSGVGVFHASIVVGLSTFTVSRAQALGFAFAYHAFSLVVVLIVGSIGLWQSGRTLAQVAAIGKAESRALCMDEECPIMAGRRRSG